MNKREWTSRFPVEMDIAVHRKFKAECARLGVSMASVIREMLRQEAERLAGQAKPPKTVKPLKTRSASGEAANV